MFSGTGSIGKVAKQHGWDVVSLDITKKSKATITADIMTWDYKKAYPVGHFDLITASPVCAWWSHLRKSNYGRKLKGHGGRVFTNEIRLEDIEKYAKPMVDRTLEIINYFKPKYWWIENPQNGEMKGYEPMKVLPWYDVDYCMYADWGYKKRTRIWTNIRGFTPLKCDGRCPSSDGKRHRKVVGFSQRVTEDGTVVRNRVHLLKGKNYRTFKATETSRDERYRVPQKLIRELLNTAFGLPHDLLADIKKLKL